MTYPNQGSQYNVLRLPDVVSQTGLSRSAIYARISEGLFPKQICLGSSKTRAVGWLESDIQNWIKSRLADSRMVG
jgi:prophage regulatory protein